MHRFYSKSRKKQNRILFLSALLIFLPVALTVLLSAYFRMYGLMFLSIMILSTFACFIDVPIGNRNGVFIYHSPLLFSTPEKNRTIEIHGGTLFDYYFTLDRRQTKSERKKIVIYYYIDGLLNLIDHYESESGKGLQLQATSYVLNERTATRMGFTKSKPDYVQLITMMLNILPILCAYYYTRTGPPFPDIFKVQTFKAPVKDLIIKKEHIRQLRDRLNQTTVI